MALVARLGSSSPAGRGGVNLSPSPPAPRVVSTTSWSLPKLAPSSQGRLLGGLAEVHKLHHIRVVWACVDVWRRTSQRQLPRVPDLRHGHCQTSGPRATSMSGPCKRWTSEDQAICWRRYMSSNPGVIGLTQLSGAISGIGNTSPQPC